MPILSSPLLGLETALLASPSPTTPIEVMIRQFLIIPIPYSNGLATLVLYSTPIEARNISVSEMENPCALPPSPNLSIWGNRGTATPCSLSSPEFPYRIHLRRGAAFAGRTHQTSAAQCQIHGDGKSAGFFSL